MIITFGRDCTMIDSSRDGTIGQELHPHTGQGNLLSIAMALGCIVDVLETWEAKSGWVCRSPDNLLVRNWGHSLLALVAIRSWDCDGNRAAQTATTISRKTQRFKFWLTAIVYGVVLGFLV
jgi:hypothetical protein